MSFEHLEKCNGNAGHFTYFGVEGRGVPELQFPNQGADRKRIIMHDDSTKTVGWVEATIREADVDGDGFPRFSPRLRFHDTISEVPEAEHC